MRNVRMVRVNIWKQMDDKQKKRALRWVRDEINFRVTYPALAGIAVFGGLYGVLVIYRLTHGQDIAGSPQDYTFILFLIVTMFLAYKIWQERYKTKAIRKDYALITPVTIISKGSYRKGHSYRHYIKVRGLYEYSKPVDKNIVISRRLYNLVSPDDEGYAIRFDSAVDDSLPSELGFILK